MLIAIEQESQYHRDSMTKGANNINHYTRGGLPNSILHVLLHMLIERVCDVLPHFKARDEFSLHLPQELYYIVSHCFERAHYRSVPDGPGRTNEGEEAVSKVS